VGAWSVGESADGVTSAWGLGSPRPVIVTVPTLRAARQAAPPPPDGGAEGARGISSAQPIVAVIVPVWVAQMTSAGVGAPGASPPASARAVRAERLYRSGFLARSAPRGSPEAPTPGLPGLVR
jgi:hypothetical protein